MNARIVPQPARPAGVRRPIAGEGRSHGKLEHVLLDRGGARCTSGCRKEQEALRDELRAYYDKLLTPEVEDDLRKGEGVGQVSKDVWKQMCADGWAGVGWPKEWGGRGMTPIEQFVFFDESMRAGAPVPMLTINSVAPTIMRYGSRGAEAVLRRRRS